MPEPAGRQVRESGTSGDVLSALRTATGARHAVLDQEMPLSKALPTLRDYRDHLLILKAWLEPLEQSLAQFDDGPQDPRHGMQKSHLLQIEADLTHAAMPLPDADAGSGEAGRLAPLPVIVSSRFAAPAYRWGVCYVIEGSQLGGAVLQRRLAERLAPHPLGYLGKDGASPGPAWMRFVAALRTHVGTDDAIAEACAGACDAFDRILALHRQANGAE